MSRNPYHREKGGPALKKSALAFVDILGYRTLIAEAETDGSQEGVLRKLYDVLSSSRGWLAEHHPDLPALKEILNKDLAF